MKNHLENGIVEAIQELFGRKTEDVKPNKTVNYGIAKSSVRMELRPLSDFEFEYVKIWDPRSIKND